MIARTHTCVLQKAGVRGRHPLCGCVGRCICVAEFHLASFCMIAHTHVCFRSQESVVAVSMACVCFCLRDAPVHVRQKQAIVRCHGSCDGDCPGMCFELGVRCHGIFRSTCVRARSCPFQRHTLAVTIAGAVHVCLCARTHTQMCVEKNKEFVVIPRLAPTLRLSFRIYQCVAQISVPLGVVGGAYMCDHVISRAHAVTM